MDCKTLTDSNYIFHKYVLFERVTNYGFIGKETNIMIATIEQSCAIWNMYQHRAQHKLFTGISVAVSRFPTFVFFFQFLSLFLLSFLDSVFMNSFCTSLAFPIRRYRIVNNFLSQRIDGLLL